MKLADQTWYAVVQLAVLLLFSAYGAIFTWLTYNSARRHRVKERRHAEEVQDTQKRAIINEFLQGQNAASLAMELIMLHEVTARRDANMVAPGSHWDPKLSALAPEIFNGPVPLAGDQIGTEVDSNGGVRGEERWMKLRESQISLETFWWRFKDLSENTVVPEHFFRGGWFYKADNFRKVCEPLFIANWFRAGFHKTESGGRRRYQDGPRPSFFKFIHRLANDRASRDRGDGALNEEPYSVWDTTVFATRMDALLDAHPNATIVQMRDVFRGPKMEMVSPTREQDRLVYWSPASPAQ